MLKFSRALAERSLSLSPSSPGVVAIRVAPRRAAAFSAMSASAVVRSRHGSRPPARSTGAGAAAQPQASPDRSPSSSAMGGAPAVVVYSRMSLLGLREIDTEKQTWTGDLYWEFLFAFVKPAFSGTPEQRSRAEVVEDALAAPAEITSKHPFALVFWPVLCHTDGGSPHCDVWVRAARGDVRESVLRAGGFTPAHYNVVSFSMRCTTSIYQRFQLALFPFDDQILRTRIVLAQEHSLFVFAAGAEAERVFLADGGGVKRFIIAVNGASSPVLGEWELVGNALAVACLSSRESSRTKKQYAVLKTLILVHRHWAHHITHFYIPAFTILLLSWLTFKLDGKSRDNRTGVLGGLIFSVLSLKTQVSNILPRLGESTILDVFLWYVFFYVSSIALVIYITKATAWVLPVFSRAINMYWLLPQSLFNSVCGVPPSEISPASTPDAHLDDCQEKLFMWIGIVGLLAYFCRVLRADSFEYASKQLFNRDFGVARGCFPRGGPGKRVHVPDNMELDELQPGESWPLTDEPFFGRKNHYPRACWKLHRYYWATGLYCLAIMGALALVLIISSISSLI